MSNSIPNSSKDEGYCDLLFLDAQAVVGGNLYNAISYSYTIHARDHIELMLRWLLIADAA